MSAQTFNSEDGEQARALLAALGDEFNQRVLRLLMAESLTQAQLAARIGMKQPQLSRRLAPLKDIGLLHGGSGRGVAYRVEHRTEIYSALIAANDLAEAINVHRSEAQRRASQRLLGERQDSDPADAGH